MSDIRNDDELVRDYLSECREHLATIETDLLAIEQLGEQIDEDLVNRVFRAAHSIKGGAGFFDLATIRELAHKTENVLDMVRSRQMKPTPEVVSILLLAFDKLRELLANHQQSNGAEIGDFVSALTRLTTENLPEERRGSVTEQVTVSARETAKGIRVSEFDLSQVRKGGKCIYLISYDLIHDIQRRDKTPLEVMKQLESCGVILETLLDFESAGTLDEEPTKRLLFEVLYATVLEPDLIGQLVEVPAESIQLIDASGQQPPRNNTPEPTQPVSRPEPVPVQGPTPLRTTAAAISTGEATIRLNVTLLDSLMTLAGELVLSRNQLNEALAKQDHRAIRSGAQRVSLVTSELQEVVTLTRMQPIGNLFSKFPRVVRDLGRDLAKDVQLRLEGTEVEIDKTILEGLSDPLTHMVRNSVDHGIECAADRIAAGKPAGGTVILKAAHQAGQVVLEISDDGKGLDGEKIANSSVNKGLITREQLQSMSDRDKMALLFLPGVSTAEKVSDVSGRGVGMDVVKTNLDKLGGKVEIESQRGRGTTFRIKLPLTLAIIPSLLVSDSKERFALPQVNVSELIRIPAGQLNQRTDRIGNANVLILRDRLVPLVYLSDALGTPRLDYASRALNIVLVNTGVFEYGLVVEELHDTAEIVVKPLGRHMKGLHEYAGATILGDGRVAVILDVAGLAQRAGVSAATLDGQGRTAETDQSVSADEESYSLLLFQNSPSEPCAIPIHLVARVEGVSPSQIEHLGGRRTMQYRGACLPVIALNDAASVGQIEESQTWVVIVFEQGDRSVGLLAAEPLDMIETRLPIDRLTLKQPGIAGSAVIKGRTTLMVDVLELAASVFPDKLESKPEDDAVGVAPAGLPTVLVAEDSDFFRDQIRRLVEAVGYPVITATDGQAAWELLNDNAGSVGIVATDVEMPRLDGLGLTRRIRGDARFHNLPVIALSSLAGDDEINRGLAAGVSEYQVKLNKDELMSAIRKMTGGARGPVQQAIGDNTCSKL